MENQIFKIKTIIMKKLIFIFSVILFASCSSDDDAGDVITTEFERIETVLPQGTWEVTKFIKDNREATIDFESFVFTFDEDGSVIGVTDLFSETGTWVYRTTSQDGEQLVLEFNDVTPFDEISDDWKIVSVSNSRIELSDDGSSEGDTDLLVFSKL